MKKHNTKAMVLFIVAMLLIPAAYGAISALLASNPTDAVSSSYRVVVTFLNQDPAPAEPGSYVTVRFKVDNRGMDDLDDVIFEILPEYPFSLDQGEDAQIDIGSLFGRQMDDYGAIIEWKLRVDKDAVEGDNEIKLRYTHPQVEWITLEEFTIEVRTHDAIINVESYKSTPERVSSGNTVKLDIKLKNLADSLLKDIETSLRLPDNFAPVGSSDEKTVKSLGAGKTTTISYELMVDKDAESKVHKIPFELTYSDELGNAYAKNTTIGVIVDNPPKYVLNLEESDIYMDDKKGNIVVSFSDVGFSDINFVRLTLLESEDYEMLSTPMVYLGNVEPDDYQTAEFELFVHIEEDGGDLPLRFRVEYTDDYNRETAIEETLDMQLYSAEEAQKYGYMPAANKYAPIFGAIIGILLAVFWLQMLVAAIRSRHNIWKKMMWIFLLVTTLVIGAVLYYLFGRKVEE